MTGPDRARQPGWRALPGDVLYAGGQTQAKHGLPEGFYVLVGQRDEKEILLRNAVRGVGGDGGGTAWRATSPGGVIVVRRQVLNKMVTTGERVAADSEGKGEGGGVGSGDPHGPAGRDQGDPGEGDLENLEEPGDEPAGGDTGE